MEGGYERIISEYEKTLAMYAEKNDDMKQKLERSNEDKGSFIRERDQALEDLNNVESAFSDLHKRYERSKTIIMNLKENEVSMAKRDQELNLRIENREKKLEMYKQTAQEKVEQMYQDYEQKLKDIEAENTRLRAQSRLVEMKLSTLEHDAEQKAKENLQLRVLCDELINGQAQANANKQT